MLKNKIFIALFLVVFLGSLFYAPKTVFAASCSINFTSTPNQNLDTIGVKVTSSDLPSGTYQLLLTTPNSAVVQDAQENLAFKNGKIIDSLGNEQEVVFKKSSGTGRVTGKYRIDFALQGKPRTKDNALCSKEFTIDEIPAQPACTAFIISKPIEPDTEVKLVIKNITASNKSGILGSAGFGGYDVKINENYRNLIYSTDTGDTMNLGTFPTGAYTVQIKDRCGFSIGIVDGCSIKSAQLQCPTTAFEVAPAGSGRGGPISASGATKPTCQPHDRNCSSVGIECNGGKGILTAIGCVPTNPTDFIQALFKFGLGIGGGIAFLLMIFGAFEMITSAGNPETLKAGQQRFTSAIIGLLFVIFSVILLKIIGIDILGLGQAFGLP